MTTIDGLKAFLGDNNIKYYTPDSAGYKEVRQAFLLNDPAVPLAIARPNSANQVAQLVSYAVYHGIELSVRSGGRDVFSRTYSQGALTIDMRDIAHVEIEHGGLTANIGGGIQSKDLVEALSRHKLATAVGTCPNVGYISWATHGGYGPLSANYGLGADQIVGAKIVNHVGEIVDAEEEILEAIRGAGGTLGVIVEMKIRLYPLEKVLGGSIVYESRDVSALLKKLSATHEHLLATEGLPDELAIQRFVVDTPAGRTLVVGFLWSSEDVALGREYLDKFVQLGDTAAVTVTETTVSEWLKASAAFLPDNAYGAAHAISVRAFTEDVISAIGEQLGSMPNNTGAALSIHELRGRATVPNIRSVFPQRERHFLLEILSLSKCEEEARVNLEWSAKLRQAIKDSDNGSGNVLPSTYLPLTPPGEARFPVLYGQNWQKLVDVKKRYDPQNVFKNTAYVQF